MRLPRCMHMPTSDVQAHSASARCVPASLELLHAVTCAHVSLRHVLSRITGLRHLTFQVHGLTSGFLSCYLEISIASIVWPYEPATVKTARSPNL